MRFVNYYRRIHALLPQGLLTHNTQLVKQGMAVFICVFLLSFTVTLSSLLLTTYSQYRDTVAVKNEIEEKYGYWEKIILQHPQFPAAYYEAAVYAIQLNDRAKAKELLSKALQIDPNFFEAEALAKELE